VVGAIGVKYPPGPIHERNPLARPVGVRRGEIVLAFAAREFENARRLREEREHAHDRKDRQNANDIGLGPVAADEKEQHRDGDQGNGDHEHEADTARGRGTVDRRSFLDSRHRQDLGRIAGKPRRFGAESGLHEITLSRQVRLDRATVHPQFP
jgi:hypothetical protein